jgi:[protein-PII] uridylyltransferase
MHPEWATVEAGSAVTELLDDRRLGSKTTSLAGLHDGASSIDSVRHALRAIASDPAEVLDRRRWLARVRPLVDRSQAMLRARFEAEGSVTPLLRGRAGIADGAVIGLLHLARAVARSDKVVTAIAPVTVLAVGGYGRRELAPASDLDLLFLLGDPAARAYAERLIGFVLAGLWDLGFEVGHTSRTLAECEELASAEPKVLVSLLDARFLAGSFSPFVRLETAVRQMAKEIGVEAFAAALAPRLSTLPDGARVADEEEPDVKRGPGALRDIQRLLWLARLKHVGTAAGGLRELARLHPTLATNLGNARRFLWQVRCHLHLLAGRAQDRLLHELQPLVARRLGFGRGSDIGVAELMGCYHAHTRAVRALLTAP